jgi:hypothetical protein
MMHDHLKDIFNNINDWLKFAEAKNAALIAFNGAIIMGCLSLIKEPPPHLPVWYLWMVVVLVALSTFCALLSFYPKTAAPGNNLYFYDHIYRYSSKQYLEYLSAALPNDQARNSIGGDSAKVSAAREKHLTEHLAEQIVINSKIASRKYKYFKVALSLLMTGLIVPLIVLFVQFLFPEFVKLIVSAICDCH